LKENRSFNQNEELQKILTDIELYSSAFTLSDMEIFVFPELLYALVLANIMSPVIWEWRKDPWFKGIEKKPSLQRINRLKQFIMHNFVFNLDLETWGLTTQEKELARFKSYLSEETIAASNALFGYEGDRYYFGVDIRKHFGLDKYTDNVIPFWKTETVEAMEAFRNKPGYDSGAGECVSLSTLYAAALFIVARIPLEKIFLMATPLHSQNFIEVQQGVLTNNRRIVTKNMWFNGTSLSTKARRALENEEVTVVSHISGNIHTIYTKASIDRKAYKAFKHTLSKFLRANLQPEIISNFMRKEREYQCCFQYRHTLHGKPMYIEVEKIYRYEHTSPNSFSTDSRGALLNEIDTEEFSLTPIAERIPLNDFEDFIRTHPDLEIDDLDHIITHELMIELCPRIENMFQSLKNFLWVKPRLPDESKEFVETDRLSIPSEFTREQIQDYITEESSVNRTAHLAMYAFRNMERISWVPFVKAAVERNPVSLKALKEMPIDAAVKAISMLKNRSIYDGKRLALPDEVWNYESGDGVEKAFLFANVLKERHPAEAISVYISGSHVSVESRGEKCQFQSEKGLHKKMKITPDGYSEGE
jgi:hypothetical protein